MSHQILSRGTIVSAPERCKGCELCIPACPPGVLSMSTAVNEIGYHYPELAPGCTGCRACHAVCPDFVFDIYKFAEAQITTVIDDPDLDAPTSAREAS